MIIQCQKGYRVKTRRVKHGPVTRINPRTGERVTVSPQKYARDRKAGKLEAWPVPKTVRKPVPKPVRLPKLERVEKYTRVRSTRMNEKNDCAVRAVTVAANMTPNTGRHYGYDQIRELFTARGRKPRRGVYTRVTRQVLRDLGFRLVSTPRPIQKNRSAFTPKSIGKALPKGVYLCRIREHIFPLVDGKIIDWAADTKHRILELIEVKGGKGD